MNKFTITKLFILLLLLTAGSCARRNENAVLDQYTCPMHPAVIQNTPGTCPICGMDLVRKGRQGNEVKITSELNYLLKPTNAIVIASIKTVIPVKKSMNVTKHADGMITYDTRRFTSIPIRFGGRIEKLLLKYNFQHITKGQKILEIYSPELITAQRDLLYLVKSDKENAQLIDGAKEKLRLLGVSDSQINQLVSSSQESYSFGIFSPVDGYIVEEASLAGSISTSTQSENLAMDGGMPGGGSSNVKQPSVPLPSTELLTREGMYLSAGQVIFKVVNTQQVWAEFNVYQRDAAFINSNDPVQLTFDNTNEMVEAKVNFVQPFFKNGESFLKVRVYLSNPENLFRIGQLVTASFAKPSVDSMWIPLSSRLDLGTRQIAFVKRHGSLHPIEITTALQSGDWLEVIGGLDANDSIAYNAQFLVDSESFIKVRN